mgnify:CR=1 FL=1
MNNNQISFWGNNQDVNSGLNHINPSVALISTIIVIIIYFIGSFSVGFFLSESQLLTVSLSQLIFLLLPTLIIIQISNLQFKSILRLNYSIELKQIVAVIIGIIALQPIFAGYSLIQDSLIPENMVEPYLKLKNEIELLYLEILIVNDPYHLIFALIAGAILPGLCEETLFRGFLLKNLENKFGLSLSLIISSIVFSSLHFNPIQIIPLFIISVYLGYLAIKSNNLIIPIIGHILNNSISIIVINIDNSNEFENQIESIPIYYAFIMVLFGAIPFIYSLLLLNKRQS